jgi:O-antigen ligase
VELLVAIYALMAVVCAVYNFIHFREGIAQAVFEWQIGGSRVNLNETTSMAFLSLGTALFIYSRSWKLKTMALAGIVTAILALLVSFSRGPIVAGFIGVFAVIMLSPFALSKNAVIALALAIPIGGGLTYLAFPKIAENVTESVVQRLVSVGGATTDRSFNARIVEAGSIMNYVKRSPVLGYGFGVHYNFLDPLSRVTVTTYYAHNGYAWMLFKFGLPLALMLFFVIHYPALRAYTNPPPTEDRFHRGLMIGCLGVLTSMAVTHFTSNQFTQMSSVMVYPLVWAVLEYVNRHGVLGPAPWPSLAARNRRAALAAGE